MSARKRFDQELILLKQKMYHMGSYAQDALKKSSQALEQQDISLAQQVIEDDRQINELETEIEEQIIQLITTQQPVASDLRIIMATLKIVSSIERIGDFAVDISKATVRMGNESKVKPLREISLMFNIVQNMVKVCLNAYMEEDAELAKDVAGLDDHIDHLYSGVVEELHTKMSDIPFVREQVIQLAYVARFVERIADYATNISEAVCYIVSGERVDLNP
jgi:phosphate transport system protein